MHHGITVLAALLLTGCTLQYRPNPSAEDLIVIPAFKTGQPLAIINRTAPKASRLPLRGSDVQVEFQQYADAVIRLLQGELTKRGGVVEASSSREIRFDLTDVRMDQGAGRHRCVLNFTIGTGDGYFRGLQASGVGWGHETAIDGAIVEAVKAILTNDRVRQYVSE